MKKRLGIISAILVVALVLALTFVLLASAEDATEATLTVTPAGGTATTQTGSYDDMAEALNSAMSSLGEGSAVLTLTADASATKALALNGTGTESVVIDLAGYTLDVSGVSSAAITVSGVKSFELDGDYSGTVDLGGIVSTAADSAIIELAASDAVSSYKIKNLSVSYSGAGASFLNHFDGDELVIVNTDVTYTATEDGSASKMISSAAGGLTLVNSSLKDASTGACETQGIVAEGTTVRLENTEILADYVYLMNGGTWLTAADAVLEAGSAIFSAYAPTDDVVVCAGVTLKGNILGEGATKDMIKLYYGTGSTLIDTDPADKVTVATELAALAQLESGEWTLAYSGSSGAILTSITDRGTIAETVHSSISLAAGALVDYGAFETNTLATIAALKDQSHTATAISPITSTTGNGKLSLMLDFNGFDLNHTRHTWYMTPKKLFRMSVDGTNADGSSVSTYTHTRYVGGFLYATGVDSNSILTIKDVKLVAANSSGNMKYTENDDGTYTYDSTTSQSATLQIQYISLYLDSVNFVYSGEKYGEDLNGTTSRPKDPESQTVTTIMAQAGSRIVATNCTFENTSTNGVSTLVMSVPKSTAAAVKGLNRYAFLKSCEMTNVKIALTTDKGSVDKVSARASDCKIVATGTPFVGAFASDILVSDCNVILAAGQSLASGNVTILYGNGNTTIKTQNGEPVSGTHVLEEGSVLYYDEVSDDYTLVAGEAVTSVRMNKLFANGMVFQAGKPINVWGSCDTDGAVITVTLGDASATATVAGGEWEVTLPAMTYAKGLTLTVSESDKAYGEVSFRNIDVGEVWAFSGQSNANLGAYKLEDFEEYKALADLYDNIRCFSVAASLSETPLDDPNNAEWFQVNSSTVGRADSGCGLSAVGYVMATRLAVELEGNPTIAIVDINYNGKAISNFISNNYDPGASSAAAEHQIYNAMIAPLEGYNIAGFGWYQGEASSDSGECDNLSDGKYGLNVDQLYATYTETFNKNEGNAPLGLFIVQLSVYMGNPSYIRAYQEDIAATNENYHLVSASYAGSTLSDKDFALDAGDGFQYSHVHAARKSPLGLAMADSILENYYFKDQNLDIANPEIESVEVAGNTIKVTIDRDIMLMFGTEVEGFEISADGNTWVAAEGTIDGRTITLSASSVTAPVYVRYGFGRGYIELETGEKILFSSNEEDGVTYVADPASNKATTVTITTADGKVYTINTADTEIIRSILNGNVIATNGHTLPVFSTALTSSAGNN